MEPNPLKFNPEDIPEGLRDLCEFASRFGHPEYGETVQSDSATSAELLKFWAVVAPRREEVHQWLDQFPKNGSWPDGPQAFLYMLQALDYAEPESRQREVHRRRFWDTTIYPNLVKRACQAADVEFRSGNYPGVIVLLEPYESDLPRVESAKLEYARKKKTAQSLTPAHSSVSTLDSTPSTHAPENP